MSTGDGAPRALAILRHAVHTHTQDIVGDAFIVVAGLVEQDADGFNCISPHTLVTEPPSPHRPRPEPGHYCGDHGGTSAAAGGGTARPWGGAGGVVPAPSGGTGGGVHDGLHSDPLCVEAAASLLQLAKEMHAAAATVSRPGLDVVLVRAQPLIALLT